MDVVALCAAWCHVCTEFRPAFERLAAEWPRARFVWLDVEDEAQVVGDIDVENFPTLVVFRDGRPVHFGVSLPNEAVVRRTLRALEADAAPLADAPEAVVALGEHIARRG